jgi:hypothetical protein
MPAHSGHGRHPALAAGLFCGLLAGGGAAAQDAAYFSPTYAASRGSPYSEVYARTFGAPPLETAAAPPAAAQAPASGLGVVYIIEGGRLLTYSAGDYASGGGQALAGTALPTAPAGGRLYGAMPPQPAAADGPIPLLPQN